MKLKNQQAFPLCWRRTGSCQPLWCRSRFSFLGCCIYPSVFHPLWCSGVCDWTVLPWPLTPSPSTALPGEGCPSCHTLCTGGSRGWLKINLRADGEGDYCSSWGDDDDVPANCWLSIRINQELSWHMISEATAPPGKREGRSRETGL